jgi:multiple sugar transport system permease protein
MTTSVADGSDPALRGPARRPRRPLLGTGLARRERVTGMLFALPAALIFLIVLAYPIYENIRSTFLSVDLLTGRSSFAGIDNLVELSSDADLGRSVGNTVIWTVGSLVGQIGLGLIAALLIDAPWKGMRFVRQLLLIPYVVPVIASALLWQWMLDGHYGILSEPLQASGLVQVDASPLGLQSTSLATVIIINIWRGFPFAMLVFWATLQTIDQGQYEAASLDGAGRWRSFTNITLPNLLPAIAALIALRGVWTLMYFELIWLTTRGGPIGSSETIATYLYKVIMGEFRLGYGASIATVSGLSLVAIAGTVLLFRRLRTR